MENEQPNTEAPWYETEPPETLRPGDVNRNFTDEQVRQMRTAKSNGWTYREIAERFEATAPAVWCAVTGKTYKHIINPPAIETRSMEPRGSKRQSKSK